MIKWPDLVFPAINLWNCPRQEELDEINSIKTEEFRLNAFARDLEMQAEDADFRSEQLVKQIKEREFLYYLHSGRFPE